MMIPTDTTAMRLLLYCAQKFKMLIDNRYRINMVLDNLPVTAQDLLDEVRQQQQQHQKMAAQCTERCSAAAKGQWLTVHPQTCPT